MICLCCGKEIANPSEIENISSWHKKCCKKFFGTNNLPKLDIDDKKLNALAETSVKEGYTVQGVQKKMSIHLSTKPELRLTIVDYPNGYILKPQTELYENLPEYEHLAMLIAETCGIKTVPHALIKLQDQYAYITRRIDRYIKEDNVMKYAMEDFCQLSERLTEDKYRGSYEQCGKIISKYSVQKNLDLAELFMRVVFSFIIGNSDMHLKNFSLREKTPKARKYVLSEAYDLLPVNIVNPKDKDETALTLNGKKRNIRKKDFMLLAENYDISEAACISMIRSIIKKRDKIVELCQKSLLNEEQIYEMIELIDKRIKVFENL